MTGRLVVTTHHGAKSDVAIDKRISSNSFVSIPGFDPILVWGTEPSSSVPWDGRSAFLERKSVLPETGGTTLMIVTFPPDSIMTASNFDPAAAGAETLQRIPGLAELFEADNPGMHATDTIDYGIVFDGEIELELDDGKMIALRRGDVVVQNGTRHAWRNRGDKPAKLIFVLIGAKRVP